MAAAFEFMVWAMLGLALGFAVHFAKAHFNVAPDLSGEGRPLLRFDANGFATSTRVEGGDYTDAGYWDYYSWGNLRWYLMGGLGFVLGGVYLVPGGHEAARETLCGVVGIVGLVPIFCP